MAIRYCTKRYREQDGKTYYMNIFSHIRTVIMCTMKDEKIYEIDINEIVNPAEVDENSYYGWLENDGNISFVYPHLALLSVCFTYGYKAEEDRGNGKLVRVKIKENREVGRV